ncbi:hypothetical protein GCM10009830_32670 [Glycomyces endophyticus]|uniref:Uncharacterized protein n=1 Tax=Glycomyces endophyticus TaxID=480996 RepID=A0ABN2H7C5_9ACTN
MDTIERDLTATRREVAVVFKKGVLPRVNAYLREVAPRGVEVTVLVANGPGWRKAEKVDGRAEVLSIGRRENRQPGVWIYMMVVERAPRAVLKRLEHRLPGKAGRAAGRARGIHRKAAAKIRKYVFWPVYRPLRPQALRRIAGRRVEALGLDRVDRVCIVDEGAVPFGWMLANRYPDLEVTRLLDKSRHEDLPVTGPTAAPEVRAPYTRI